MPALPFSIAWAIALGALATSHRADDAEVDALLPSRFEDGLDLLRAARRDGRKQRLPDDGSLLQVHNAPLVLQQEAAAGHRAAGPEPGCRELFGGWVARKVDLSLACHEAYSAAECAEAERGVGGGWAPAMRSGKLPDRACRAIERHAAAAQRLSLLQKSRASRARGANFPDWVKKSAVIREDPGRSEWPAPLNNRPSSWEGPALTPEAQYQLEHQHDQSRVVSKANSAQVADKESWVDAIDWARDGDFG